MMSDESPLTRDSLERRYSLLSTTHFRVRRDSVVKFVVLTTLAFVTVGTSSAEKVTYQDHVQPILREHCFACHSQDDASSGLALDSYAAALAGGGGGEVLAAGDADASRLWLLITHQESPKMPPGGKVPDDQLAKIKAWIDGGLLESAGSKPKKKAKSAIGTVVQTADNRPQGEPAMPENWYREPVVSADRVGPVTSLSASPWSPLVAVAWQKQVSVYHTGNRRLLGLLPYLDGEPNVVRFSRDGSLLLVAGGRAASRGSAAVFDVKTGDRMVTVGDELDAVLAADISPDHQLIAIGGPRKKVRVYRTSDGSLAYELGKHTDWITALEFSPDGKLLATGDRVGGLLLWRADGGHARGDLRGHKQPVTSVAWRTDSSVLASTSEEGEVRLWNPNGTQIKTWRAHGGGAASVRFSKDGKLVTTGRDRHVKMWQADGKLLQQTKPLAEMTLAADFANNSNRIIASDFSGAVYLIDARPGKLGEKPIGMLEANPPRLAERLAQAEARHAALTPKAQAAADRFAKVKQSRVAAEATHAKFAEELVKAEAELADATTKHTTAQQALAAAKSVAESTAKKEAALKQVLTAAEGALKTVEEQLKESGESAVKKSLAEAVSHARTERDAAASQAKLASADMAARQNQFAESTKTLNAATAVKKQVEQKRAGLPDLAKAKQQAETARVESESQQKRLLNTAKQIQSLRKEIAALVEAPQQLARRVAEESARLEQLAGEAKTIATAREAAQKKSNEAKQAADRVTAELAKLRKQLEAAEHDAGKIAEQAEAAATELAAAEQAAERAAAREKAFAEAEEARKAMAK